MYYSPKFKLQQTAGQEEEVIEDPLHKRKLTAVTLHWHPLVKKVALVHKAREDRKRPDGFVYLSFRKPLNVEAVISALERNGYSFNGKEIRPMLAVKVKNVKVGAISESDCMLASHHAKRLIIALLKSQNFEKSGS